MESSASRLQSENQIDIETAAQNAVLHEQVCFLRTCFEMSPFSDFLGDVVDCLCSRKLPLKKLYKVRGLCCFSFTGNLL